MIARHWFAGVTIAGLVALAGCSGSSSSPSPPTPSPKPSANKEQAETAGNLAKLSADDKALAEAQKVCPISGEPLGTMGVPLKLALKGETVFLCCPSCKGKAEADPDKTLKAIADAKAKSGLK